MALPAIHLNLPGLLGDIWESILRAVPKKKTTHARKRNRQMAGKALKDVTSLAKCPGCGQVKRQHVLCPHCMERRSSAVHLSSLSAFDFQLSDRYFLQRSSACGMRPTLLASSCHDRKSERGACTITCNPEESDNITSVYHLYYQPPTQNDHVHPDRIYCILFCSESC